MNKLSAYNNFFSEIINTINSARYQAGGPIGVSEYKLTNKLPEKLKGKVPAAKELKQMLTKAIHNTCISAN